MHLRAHLSLLVRKRDPTQLRAVMGGDPGDWPVHLQHAWAILNQELAVPAPAARELMVRSSRAAQQCATRMNERVQKAEEYGRAVQVKQAFQRLSRCARRAPAKLRHLFDEKISRVLQGGEVDLETIEALFQASREAFKQFPGSEPAQTGLLALRVYRERDYDTVGLRDHISALAPPLQAHCMSALAHALRGGAAADAESIFAVLAESISPPARPPRGAADIVIDYVAVVAAAWRSAGQRAGRAFKQKDAGYTSKFHRFCDLVLTALVEPQSRRHDDGLERLAAQAWAHQRLLPREVQKYVRGGLPRRDAQWLVTAHCLRAALARFKKEPSRLHKRKA